MQLSPKWHKEGREGEDRLFGHGGQAQQGDANFEGGMEQTVLNHNSLVNLRETPWVCLPSEREVASCLARQKKIKNSCAPEP
jgi:hypothetical protein